MQESRHAGSEANIANIAKYLILCISRASNCANIGPTRPPLKTGTFPSSPTNPGRDSTELPLSYFLLLLLFFSFSPLSLTLECLPVRSCRSITSCAPGGRGTNASRPGFAKPCSHFARGMTRVGSRQMLPSLKYLNVPIRTLLSNPCWYKYGPDDNSLRARSRC